MNKCIILRKNIMSLVNLMPRIAVAVVVKATCPTGHFVILCMTSEAAG
jgi:hypothetical protein